MARRRTAGFVNKDVGVFANFQGIGAGFGVAAVSEDFAVVFVGDAHADGGNEMHDRERMDGEVLVFEEQRIIVQADTREKETGKKLGQYSQPYISMVSSIRD